jgi:hypothetical protein
MASIYRSATKQRTTTTNGINTSDDGLYSTEAKTGDVSVIEETPVYPSGITLYLVVIALMLSMFLVGLNIHR